MRSCAVMPFAASSSVKTRNAEWRRHAVCGFFECDLQVVTKIRTALCGGSTTAATATKHVAKSKQVAEDVFDPAKSGCAPRAGARPAGNTSVSKTIVTFAL